MWSRLDGASMNKLDHFLLPQNICESWNIGVSQWALEGGLSDHFPISFKMVYLNGGLGT